MNTTALTITLEPDAPPEVQTSVEAFLDDEARVLGLPPVNVQSFLALLRDADGRVQGGIKARYSWEWLHIVALAVAPSWRNQGYGTRLLTSAERWGLGAGCREAWVMTFGLRARNFYERAGYAVFAELANWPTGVSRLFMRKSISDVGGPSPSRLFSS